MSKETDASRSLKRNGPGTKDGRTHEIDRCPQFTPSELPNRVEYIENDVYFDFDDEDVSEAEITEERVDTDFGKRTCTVYTIEGTEDHLTDDSVEFTLKYYVGKNNDVLYKVVYESAYEIDKYELKKSSIMAESLSGIEVKPEEDLKVGDKLIINMFNQSTAEIAEILPAEGNASEEYRLRGYYGFKTYEEIIEYFELEIPDEVYEGEYLGTETVKTSLGRVVCDVYFFDEYGITGKLYVHNDIFIKVEGDSINMHWTHSDIVTKKSLF